MEKLLWQYQEDFYNKLDDCIYYAEEGLTLKEFLKLGFNNATLLAPDEEDTDKHDIKDLYMCFNGDYYREDLTDDMLNCEVVLSSTYDDGDGYTCAYICLSNDDDWKYFKELN